MLTLDTRHKTPEGSPNSSSHLDELLALLEDVCPRDDDLALITVPISSRKTILFEFQLIARVAAGRGLIHYYVGNKADFAAISAAQRIGGALYGRATQYLDLLETHHSALNQGLQLVPLPPLEHKAFRHAVGYDGTEIFSADSVYGEPIVDDLLGIYTGDYGFAISTATRDSPHPQSPFTLKPNCWDFMKPQHSLFL